MHFPRLVYKCPGPYQKRGHAYRYIGCADAEQWDALKAQGWLPSFDEAVAGAKAKAVVDAIEEADEAIDDISPATRDELEQKAKELGIGFNARTPDKTLAQRIADAV